MLDAIKPLLESGVVNSDTAKAINEAWESKLTEAKQQIAQELRAEYANKYDHDKSIMVEALDRMVTDSLKDEILEFKTERQAMNEDRVRSRVAMTESAKKFDQFMVKKLAEEIQELRADRKVHTQTRAKLEQFVVESLAREIREFEQDKRAVVEAKVKLVAEAKHHLATLKRNFVKESASKIKALVGKQLSNEIGQLREDIKSASESHFGRRIFEAFASEFSNTHLNEKAETRKLMQQLDDAKAKLSESVKKNQQAMKLVESKDREVKMIKESTARDNLMGELLGTLNKEKAKIMKDLLESVQTPKLKSAFDKYLPAVLNSSGSPEVKKQSKVVIAESKEVITGDKSAKKIDEVVEDRDNVIAIKRLAGL